MHEAAGWFEVALLRGVSIGCRFYHSDRHPRVAAVSFATGVRSPWSRGGGRHGGAGAGYTAACSGSAERDLIIRPWQYAVKTWRTKLFVASCSAGPLLGLCLTRVACASTAQLRYWRRRLRAVERTTEAAISPFVLAEADGEARESNLAQMRSPAGLHSEI